MFDKEKLSVSKTLKKVDTVDSSSYAPKQYMPSQVCPQKKRLIFYMHVTLTKKQPYFISILWLSHLFLSYFILTKFYFACIPCLPDEENRASILFLVCFYLKRIFSHHYSTEESWITLPNTHFCIFGSTQLFNAAQLMARMDQGHGLVDRILLAILLAFSPTLTEMEATSDLIGTDVSYFCNC